VVPHKLSVKVADASFFPSYLEGSVESWYHSVSETVQSSLQLIKEALFKRFRPSQLSVELKDINQGDGETVDVAPNGYLFLGISWLCRI
jgi:hypothetical protein